MSNRIIDASVILAILRNERLDDAAESIVDGAWMSTVNVAEVYSKLADLGITHTPAVDALLFTLAGVEPFTLQHAVTAGRLRAATRQLGLSLGDRACLALALELQGEAFTVDQAWANLQIGCSVTILR